jgi:hypothetical protein
LLVRILLSIREIVVRIFTRNYSSRLLSQQLTYPSPSRPLRFRLHYCRVILAGPYSLPLRDLSPCIILVACTTSPLLLTESELLLLLYFLRSFILIIESVVEANRTDLIALSRRIVVLSCSTRIDYTLIECYGSSKGRGRCWSFGRKCSTLINATLTTRWILRRLNCNLLVAWYFEHFFDNKIFLLGSPNIGRTSVPSIRTVICGSFKIVFDVSRSILSEIN